MKTCLCCKSLVVESAVKCKYCGSYLTKGRKYFTIFERAIAIILPLVVVLLTIMIWEYQQAVDSKFKEIGFMREAIKTRELERDYKYFEAYRSYIDIYEVYPSL